MLAAFQRAAAELAEKRAEEAMEIEDRICKYLRGWCEDWQADLEARPEEEVASGPGHQATMVYQQSMKYLEPLLERLKRRQLEPELKVGAAGEQQLGAGGSLGVRAGGCVALAYGARGQECALEAAVGCAWAVFYSSVRLPPAVQQGCLTAAYGPLFTHCLVWCHSPGHLVPLLLP